MTREGAAAPAAEQPFRIMVVDDEPYIREGICSAIDWARVGAVVAGQAASGNEALAKLGEVRPDVIITDICMEDMDGLSFTEIVKERFSHIRVIVLSGYEDFEFAKRAVELKVFRYILKPGDPDKILEAVGAALAEIRRERALEKRISALEHNEAVGRQFRYNRLFDDLLYNRILDGGELARRAAPLGIPVENTLYCAAILRMDMFYDLRFREDSNLLYVALTAAKEIAEDTLTPDFFLYCATRHSTDLVLLAGRGGEEEKAFSQRLLAGLNSIRKTVREFLKSTCTIGVGAPVPSLLAAYDSFEQAKLAIDYKIAVGNDCVISISDLPLKTRYVYPKGREKQIIGALSALDAKGAVEAVDAFMAEVAAREHSKSQLRAVLAELFAAMNRYTLEMGVDLHQVYDKEWIDPYSMLEHFSNIDDVKNLLANLLADTVGILRAERASNTRSVIRKAQEIIAENYANPDLSLSMIAERIYLNATYLSKLYKTETGETYVEYLTRLRMEAAKELLCASNLKVSDVGAAVGYPNTQYFSTLFKRLFGLSPLEYRERGGRI